MAGATVIHHELSIFEKYYNDGLYSEAEYNEVVDCINKRIDAITHWNPIVAGLEAFDGYGYLILEFPFFKCLYKAQLSQIIELSKTNTQIFEKGSIIYSYREEQADKQTESYDKANNDKIW